MVRKTSGNGAWVVAWCVALLLVCPFQQSFAQDAATAYKAYTAAYQQYRAALDRQAPQAEIDRAISTYLQAKASYENVLSRLSAPPSGAEAASSAAYDTTSGSTSGSDDTRQVVAAPQNETAAAGASNGVSRRISQQLPANIEEILETLNQTRDVAQAQALIATLEGYLQRAGLRELERDAVNFEIACALDRLNLDRPKAIAILNQLNTRGATSTAAQWAKARLNYIRGKEYKVQWQKVLDTRFNEMNTAYQRYQNTSWLAFPVKAARGIAWQAKSLTFTKTRSEYEDFLLAFEAAQAPFISNVTSVFDTCQDLLAATETADDDAVIRLIYNNYEAWYTRWKIMSEAQHTLDIQYFIIENDAFGLSFLGLCLQKAQAGVRVRLMVDMRGSNKLSLAVVAKGYLEALAKLPNVQIKIYNPVQTNLLSIFSDVRHIVSSNHDKILIADGIKCVIGGRNIADEYLVDPSDDHDAWRDTDVLIISREVSAQLKKAFEEEFELLKAMDVEASLLLIDRAKQLDLARQAMLLALQRRGALPVTAQNKDQASLINKLNKQLAAYQNMTGYSSFQLTENSHQAPVQILDSNSLSGPRNDITDNVVRYIDGSRREIIIQNPYIVLTPRAEAALVRAAKRGVPILVHTNSPQTSDSFPTEAMLYRDWRSILRDIPTMRIFAMVNRGQLHGKNFAFDTEIGIVGTYNFDFLSEKVNSEVVAAVKSDEFAQELRNEIITDIRDFSLEYHLGNADNPEFGPGDVENPQKMWLVKLLSKMGWLKPVF